MGFFTCSFSIHKMLIDELESINVFISSHSEDNYSYGVSMRLCYQKTTTRWSNMLFMLMLWWQRLRRYKALRSKFGSNENSHCHSSWGIPRPNQNLKIKIDNIPPVSVSAGVSCVRSEGVPDLSFPVTRIQLPLSFHIVPLNSESHRKKGTMRDFISGGQMTKIQRVCISTAWPQISQLL